MIDEKNLIEELETMPYIHGRFDHVNGNIDFISGIETWHEIVLNKIQSQQKIGEWIPVSERLPKETDFPEQKYRILASCSDDIVRNATIENLRDRSKKHFNGSQCEFAYLAWQSLPEPYKE